VASAKEDLAVGDKREISQPGRPLITSTYCQDSQLSVNHSFPYLPKMPRDPLIGLVGKPSSGKSTMLNR
jgi:putative protein kinase ArgK-like GTPase of G3E family